MRFPTFLSLSCASVLLAACGGSETVDSGVDSGRPDATTDSGHDGGLVFDDMTDFGQPDTGVDSGGMDAGDIDGGPSDSGFIDESDLGQPDAGADLGTPDTGADLGTPDTGTDLGTPDAGAPDAIVLGGPCRHDADCDPSEWCEAPDGSCGGDGTCTPPPTACTGSGTVCGCDGETHTSACDAHLHRTSVAHAGACSCPTSAPSGCCFSNAGCAAGQVCRTFACPSVGVAVAGVCEAATTTGLDCWDDRDCGGGASCVGASVCPCGSACLVPDSVGTCMTL